MVGSSLLLSSSFAFQLRFLESHLLSWRALTSNYTMVIRILIWIVSIILRRWGKAIHTSNVQQHAGKDNVPGSSVLSYISGVLRWVEGGWERKALQYPEWLALAPWWEECLPLNFMLGPAASQHYLCLSHFLFLRLQRKRWAEEITCMLSSLSHHFNHNTNRSLYSLWLFTIN